MGDLKETFVFHLQEVPGCSVLGEWPTLDERCYCLTSWCYNLILRTFQEYLMVNKAGIKSRKLRAREYNALR